MRSDEFLLILLRVFMQVQVTHRQQGILVQVPPSRPLSLELERGSQQMGRKLQQTYIRIAVTVLLLNRECISSLIPALSEIQTQ